MRRLFTAPFLSRVSRATTCNSADHMVDYIEWGREAGEIMVIIDVRVN